MSFLSYLMSNRFGCSDPSYFLGFSSNLVWVISLRWAEYRHCIRCLNELRDLIQIDNSFSFILDPSIFKAFLSGSLRQLIHRVIKHNFGRALQSQPKDTQHELLQIFESYPHILIWKSAIFFPVLLVDHLRIRHHLVHDLALHRASAQHAESRDRLLVLQLPILIAVKYFQQLFRNLIYF